MIFNAFNIVWALIQRCYVYLRKKQALIFFYFTALFTYFADANRNGILSSMILGYLMVKSTMDRETASTRKSDRKRNNKSTESGKVKQTNCCHIRQYKKYCGQSQATIIEKNLMYNPLLNWSSRP